MITAGPRQIDAAAAFGKVAVLMGGTSAEREISLMTGRAVHEALLRQGVDAHAVDTANDLMTALQAGGFSRVWIALHGRGGEDGTLQGLLTHLGIPFTGSGVLGSALCMDKLRTKQLLAGVGIGTPRFRILRGEQDFDDAVGALGLPLMIKPSLEGSSIGLTKVTAPAQLPAAFADAAAYQCDVFAEQWITSQEYTAAVLHDRVLPLIRIDAANTFYDYEAKYFRDDTRYICPSGLPENVERAYAAIALAAFEAAGASGWGRVDFMLDDDAEPLILDINTVPGMTGHSLVPMAAAQAGIDFDDLVWRILETSLTRQRAAESGTEAANAP